MATSSVILNIKANTDRALSDFKKFSAQLDNKFLMSGLKLDVVRSALGQINREFQKAIGEQGLQAGQSIRAAENQVALLSQTFKGFSSSASTDMATRFSTAFSEIAVKAGGTAKDIQKALAATPFISTDLSEDMRKALGEGIFNFQRDFSRAGLSEDFAGIARQFLMGQLTAEQMINSGDSAQQFFGDRLSKITGQIGYMGNAKQRSEAVLKFVQDQALVEQVGEMAKRAGGFKAIIEDLNTKLFNPKKGVFGSLREVTMAVGEKTTIFDETTKLIDSVFGRQGFFVNFFKQIGKIFGIEDPLKVIIIGIKFITKQFDKLNKFVQDPAFQNIVQLIQGAFTNVKNFFTTLGEQIESGNFEPEPIKAQIQGIGKGIRDFFKKIGDAIRGTNISEGAEEGTSILNTIIDELGTTIISFFKEIGGALLEKAGTIAGKLIEVLPGTIAKLFGSLFTEGGIVGKAIGAAIAIRLGVAGLRTAGSVRQVFAGPGGIGGAANRFLNKPFGPFGKPKSKSPKGEELASKLGTTQNFYRQVIFYLSRIADCVCGGPNGPRRDGPRRIPADEEGVLEQMDIDAPREKGERVGRDGRTSRQRALDMRRRRRRGGFFRGFKRRTRNSISRLGGLGFEVLAALKGDNDYDMMDADDMTDADDMMDADVPRRGERVGSDGRTSRQRALDMRRRRSGGRFGRLSRGLRGFGGKLGGIGRGIGNLSGKVKGFGVAGALMAGFTLMDLFNNKAGATEVDPITGEPILKSPEQKKQEESQRRTQAGTELFGLAGGAIGGAAGTAIAGPLGGMIGAALGDTAGRALASMPFMQPVTEALGKFAEDSIKWIANAWENAKKALVRIKQFFTTDIPDLFKKGLSLLSGDLPGKLLEFGKNLGKSMLDSISNFNLGQVLQNTWSTITNIMKGDNSPPNSPPGRAAGGIVEAGRIYDFQENGRELLIPNVNGSVMNNATLSSLLSRRSPSPTSSPINATFNITFKVDGVLGIETIDQLRDPVVAIVEEAWGSATAGTVNRGTVV